MEKKADTVSQYARDKVAESIGAFPRVESVHVILNLEGYRHIAELVIQGKSHLRVEATSESDDMYVSIDSAIDKAVKQLRRSRDKVQDHQTADLAEAEKIIRQEIDADENASEKEA